MLSTDFLCGGQECRSRTSHTHLSCQDTESCDYFQVSTFQFTEMLRYAEDLYGRGGETGCEAESWAGCRDLEAKSSTGAHRSNPSFIAESWVVAYGNRS